MNEMMTWKEIEAEFDGEWVLVADPEMTGSLAIIQGRVIFHSKSRAEIHEKIMELPKLNHAVMFIGQPSANVVFAL